MVRSTPIIRSGHTLLELIMATAIVAATLVPALSLFRDSMRLSREIERRNIMALYCIATLEEQLAMVGASWSSGTDSGDYANDGFPNLHFLVERSDQPSHGGIANRLMSIVVTVFDDLNQNNAMGTDEPKLVFRSKMARLASYTYEASS